MLRFTCLRVPVFVHPSLWIVLLICGGIYRVNSWGYPVDILTFVLAGFVSLLVHEMGHALAGQYLTKGHAQIYLAWVGGNCWMPDVEFSRWKGMLVTLAGPLANIVVGCVSLAILYYGLGSWDLMKDFYSGQYDCDCAYSQGLLYLVRHLTTFCFFWCILNILPIYPLDGGQLLAGCMDSMRQVHMISMIAAIVMAVMMMSLGMWLLMLFFICLLIFNLQLKSKLAG